MLRAAVVVLLVAFLSSYAQAEPRIALLIGNQGYATEVGPLRNPHNDIRLVGASLSKVGFEVLRPVLDADRQDILRAVHDYARRLQLAGPEAVGFLYYSGHGVAVDGDNFIIPINVKSTTRLDLELDGIRLTEIINLLNSRAPQAVHFIVFDACRNNLGGVRGAKGFVPVAENPGMLIAFSTAPGTTASDQGEYSGPYAQALAVQLVQPGNHMELFFAVRRRVADITRREQIPWTQDGLMRQVHFSSLEVSPPPQPDREAAEAYDRIKDPMPISTTPRPGSCSAITNQDVCDTWPGCEWMGGSVDGTHLDATIGAYC